MKEHVTAFHQGGAKNKTPENDTCDADPELVSVLIPVYNGEAYLALALESILEQTYQHLQIVVVDDGSTDATTTILDGYTDPRLQVISIDNVGITKALNHGLKHCEGNLICRMDADDIAAPTRISAQVAHLHSEGVDVSWCNASLIDEEGNAICRRFQPGEDFTIKFLDQCNFILHPGVLMWKASILAANGYDESYKSGQDYDLWKRMKRNGARFALLDEPLMQYRISNVSISAKAFAFPSERDERNALVCLKNRDRKRFWYYFRRRPRGRFKLLLRYLVGERLILYMRISLRFLKLK